MSLHLRVDDFPGTKPKEFDLHNLRNYHKFHDILKFREIPYIIGVIPKYTTPNDLMFFRNSGVTVALHGIHHNESSLDEFGDMEYSVIENALRLTKRSLEASLETSVVDYIPPHNTINVETINVLSSMGFKNVYGGPETSEEAKEVIVQSGMKYIHSEPPLEYGRSDELMQRGSVQYLRENSSKRDIYLTLHWPWEINIGLHNLRKYLDQIHDLF